MMNKIRGGKKKDMTEGYRETHLVKKIESRGENETERSAEKE